MVGGRSVQETRSKEFEAFESIRIYQSVQRDRWLSNTWQRSRFTEVKIQRRYGDIPNRSDAGVFKVRISVVWRQFPLEQDEVTGRRLGAACLVNFLDSLTGGRENISQNDAQNSSERPKKYNTGLR